MVNDIIMLSGDANGAVERVRVVAEGGGCFVGPVGEMKVSTSAHTVKQPISQCAGRWATKSTLAPPPRCKCKHNENDIT